MNLHVQLLHLADIPRKQLAELALVALRAGGDEGAAQPVASLIDDRPVPAQRQHPRRLHAADAASDDGDGLRARRLPDVVLASLHGFGVDRAAGQMQGIHQVLIVGHALVVAHVEAAVVAEDAGADVLPPVLHQLRHPRRIGEEGARKARAVQLARGDGLRRGLRRQPPGADDGNVHEAADVAHVRKVAILRHVDRRMRPVPRVVGAVVAVQHVVARVLQEPCGKLGFRHVAPDLGVAFAGKRALPQPLGPGDDAVAQRHGEILPAGGLDGLDNLRREAVAVLQ